MAAPQQTALRRAMTLGVMLAAFVLLGARLAWIQGVRHGAWSSLARKFHETRRPLPSRRGMIVDRNGVKLAVTVSARSVCANPRAVADKRRAARLLAGALKMDEAALRRRLDRSSFFVWLKRRVSASEAEAVDRLGLAGVGFRREPLRVYPNGDVAAHVLGFVGSDDEGLAGVEQKFDRALAGRPGFEIVLRDGCGRIIAAGGPRYQAAVHGSSLVLSIDSVIQQLAEETLRATVQKWHASGGAAVVLEAGTSHVLALASFPTFDPNRFGGADKCELLNRATTMVFEPGSTFKPLTMAAALDANMVHAETRVFCHNGAYNMDGRVLHDSHPYAWLSVRDVIVRSSNIGVAQVAARLGRYGLHHAATRFGIGRRTGIELPGEEPGLLRPPHQWTAYSMGSVPMGQEIAVTALGLAAGYNVFAGDGRYHAPRLVIGLADNDGRNVTHAFPCPEPRPVVRRDVARLIRDDFLRGVVERGTGKRAGVNGYVVGGKTGTAQIARKGGGGYEPDQYIASFVGIAPIPDARAVCLVMIERPKKVHYGGTVAAPAVAAILERTLSYQGVPRSGGAVAMR